MFKYISSILAQFTSGQKIIALSLLLLSIVFVTLGPSLVNTITLDRDELTQDLKNKEVRIKKLESDIDTLSEKIRNNQMECTDQITLREKKFIRMLDELKSELKTPGDNPFGKALEMRRDGGNGNGGVESSHRPVESRTITIINTNDHAIEMIEKMQRDLKKGN